ncbi:MAG: class I SAM-dependent methyltransferase [Anaerolineales bacterium]
MNQTPEHREIYAQHADQYELLVSREDHESNIPRALDGITSFDAKDVVELGAGTGRLARLLAPAAKSVHAFDASPNMLQVAAAKLQGDGSRNWSVAAADHRSVPLAAQSADVVISGWSVVYLVVWHMDTWKHELARGLAEMRRILRPGGRIIILETLGTGHASPQPPDNLLDYYSFLEQEGFASSWIRTDYRFESSKEAEHIVSFFFGEEMVSELIVDGSITLPECTGIWNIELE